MVAEGAKSAKDTRITHLVRAGKIRAALFLPQFATDAATGNMRGDVHLVEIAGALAERLGVELTLVGYPNPAEAIEGLKAGECDFAFLGIDPTRAVDVSFSPPFVELDYTYLVPPDSPIRRIADVDLPGIRVAAVSNHASTIALAGLLENATLVYADTPDATFRLLRAGRADAMASVAYALGSYIAQWPGAVLLEGRYGANRLALAVAKAEIGWLAYLTSFVADAKASGLLQAAIDRGGLGGIHVSA